MRVSLILAQMLDPGYSENTNELRDFYGPGTRTGTQDPGPGTRTRRPGARVMMIQTGDQCPLWSLLGAL